MSDSHHPSAHDHPEPDQAALDELSQAFAEEAPSADGRTSDEFVIVEQDPLPDEDESDRTRPADTPHVIRIDDDSAGGDEASAESPPASPVEANHSAVAGERETIVIGAPDGAEFAGSGVDGERETIVIGDAAAPRALSGEPHVFEIDDEDLPDAVYVEGSLDRDGSRSIVFIEDDDTGDALQPESERDLRRGIEPRMRERRVAIKRAQSRKRLKWVILAAIVVVIGVGALAVLGSSLFAVRSDQVTVTGAVYTDQQHLDDILDDLVGTPVLLVDTQDFERRLEEIPWVEDAKVTTSFPRSATIDLREREAQATYQGPDGRFRVIDAEGRVLDVIDGQPVAYVLVGGPDPVDLEPGEFAPRGYAAAAELVKNFTGSLRGQVTLVEVTADGTNLVVYMTDGTTVRFGEARDLFAKLVRLETVLSSTEERGPGTIDVSTREVTR